MSIIDKLDTLVVVLHVIQYLNLYLYCSLTVKAIYRYIYTLYHTCQIKGKEIVSFTCVVHLTK